MTDLAAPAPGGEALTGAVLPPAELEMPPGYYPDRWYGTRAWMTLPWPADLADLPPSLGPAVIAWAEWRTYADTGVPGLIHPIWGGRWRFTPGQRRFLHQWYAYDPDTGRWLYRRGVKRGAKGTGKDPFLAALCLGELVGPVRLVRHPDTGEWMGVRHRMPLVQIASNSSDQSKDVLRVANGMLPAETRDYFGIDCGQTRTILKDTGGRLEVLTASEESSEGDPATFIALNETHHMTRENRGHGVAAVARRNVGKSPADLQARMVDGTNAHLQGEDSVAERTFDAWQMQASGEAKLADILYDSIEAPPDTDMADDESLRAGLAAAYCDAPWSDLERLRGEALDPETTPADAVRYYLNGLGEEQDAWVSPIKFRLLARKNDTAPGAQITMFLDCSKSTDATALMGCRLWDGFVFTLGMWKPPPGKRGEGWLVPRELVDAAVRGAFETYRVEGFGVDPSPALDDDDESLYWLALTDAWHRDFRRQLRVWATPGETRGNAVLFDMRIKTYGGIQRNQAFTQAAMAARLDIDEFGTLQHDGDPRLIRHVTAARRRPNQWGESLSKVTRGSSKLVDLAVAMVGARMMRRNVLNSGRVRDELGRRRSDMVMNASEATQVATDMLKRQEADRAELDVLRQYWKGRQPLPAVIPASAPREVHEMARTARVNVISIVVESITQSMIVDSMRAADQRDDSVIQQAWRIWQSNGMDRRQFGLTRAVTAYGTGYMSVMPGAPVPVMRPAGPRQMTALYGADDLWPVRALERRPATDTFRLIDAEAVYEFRRAGMSDGLELVEPGAEHGMTAGGTPVCPVVRYTDVEDLDLDDEATAQTVLGGSIGYEPRSCIVAGQVAPLIPLQDQVNLTSFSLKAAEWYSAFRQRWMIGKKLGADERVQSAASQIWSFDEEPDRLSLGEFSQTDLRGYIESRAESMKFAATLSQTPVHELVGELVNLSAEALAAAEIGRDRMVGERKTGMSESHEQTLGLAVERMGGDPLPVDAEMVYRDTSARAFGAVVDGLGKLSQMLQVPPQELWEKIPGTTKQEIGRWKKAFAEGDALTQMNMMLEQQARGGGGAPQAGAGRTASGLILPPGVRP